MNGQNRHGDLLSDTKYPFCALNLGKGEEKSEEGKGKKSPDLTDEEESLAKDAGGTMLNNPQEKKA